MHSTQPQGFPAVRGVAIHRVAVPSHLSRTASLGQELAKLAGLIRVNSGRETYNRPACIPGVPRGVFRLETPRRSFSAVEQYLVRSFAYAKQLLNEFIVLRPVAVDWHGLTFTRNEFQTLVYHDATTTPENP